MPEENDRRLSKTLGELAIVFDDFVGLASQGDFLIGQAYKELRQASRREPKVVLIVDDDQMQVKALTRSLKSDFQIVPAGSVEEAIDVLRTMQVDAIIADLELKEGTGLDVLRVAMREQSEAVRILHTGAIAPLSPHARVGNVVQHLVNKPADPQIFRDIIRVSGPGPVLPIK